MSPHCRRRGSRERMGGCEHGESWLQTQVAKNAGEAKGQMILIGILDMLRCVCVRAPLRSLLLCSHHMSSQNKMRLLAHNHVKNLSILFGKAAERSSLCSLLFMTRCPAGMSSNLCCQLRWGGLTVKIDGAKKKKCVDSNLLIIKRKRKHVK